MSYKIAVSGAVDKIKFIATGPFRGVRKVIYEKDPKQLVKKLITFIEKEKKYYRTRGRRAGKS